MTSTPTRVIASPFSTVRASLARHPAVNVRLNPIIGHLPALTQRALLHVAVQYSIFPRHIVAILETAESALDSWSGVAKELARNIAEETGAASCSGSHYSLLRDGFEHEFGLVLSDEDPATATALFLETCYALAGCNNAARAAGATYAIEASAVGEIEVLRCVLNRLSILRNGRGLRSGGALDRFIALHVETFEPEHEAGLREALVPHICARVATEFEHSFEQMMSAMDTWWARLTLEAVRTAPTA
jgi:hypothetical protein